MNGPRTINRTQWKTLYRAIRENGGIEYFSPRLDADYARRVWVRAVCDENQDARELLDRVTVDGQIGIIVSGMDCDCCAYHRERIAPAFSSVAAFKEWERRRQENIEGTETVYFVRTDQIDRARNGSRDLALEAFEDGHPGTVYYSGGVQ